MQKIPQHGCCFVCGTSNPHTIGLTWYANPEGSIQAEFTFNQAQQGPPGHVHGGASAAVVDEAMGAAVWLAGLRVVAARLEVDYRRPIPLGRVVHIRARIGEQHARKTLTSAEILLDGELAVSARGVYVAAPHLFTQTEFEHVEPRREPKDLP